MARPPLRLNLNKVTNRDAGRRAAAAAAAAAHRIGRVCPPVGRHVATTVEILALRKRSPCSSLSLTYSLFFFSALFRFLSLSPAAFRSAHRCPVESIGAGFDLRKSIFHDVTAHYSVPGVQFFPQSQRAPGIYARNAFHQKVGIDVATVNIQMLITL